MKNGIKSETEIANEALFMKTFRGIPADIVAKVMTRSVGGINFADCSKSHLAECWADEGDYGYFSRGRVRPKLEDLVAMAGQVISDRARAKAQRARIDKEVDERRARQLAERAADQKLLGEVFELAVHALADLTGSDYIEKLKQVRALQKKLLSDKET
jgi:hypothetical protein